MSNNQSGLAGHESGGVGAIRKDFYNAEGHSFRWIPNLSTCAARGLVYRRLLSGTFSRTWKGSHPVDRNGRGVRNSADPRHWIRSIRGRFRGRFFFPERFEYKDK